MNYITDEQLKEFIALTSPEAKQRNKDKDDITRLFIKDKIKHINHLVSTAKYNKAKWLKQYSDSVISGQHNRRIDELCKELGYGGVSRDLNEEQKYEIGFCLLMDYLRNIHNEYLLAKSCVNCKLVYKNITRTGEALHLFFNPLTLADLEEAYSVRRKHLSAIGAGLQSQLEPAKDDEVLVSTLNEDIAKNNKALKDLKSLYETFRNNWELKIDPYIPYIDDRKVKDLPLSNSVLKRLAVKPESNLTSGSENNKKSSPKLLVAK